MVVWLPTVGVWIGLKPFSDHPSGKLQFWHVEKLQFGNLEKLYVWHAELRVSAP